MFSPNLLYRLENFKLSLAYHRELLKIAQLARLARKAEKTSLSTPATSHKWNGLRQLFLGRRQHKRAAYSAPTAQVRF